MFFEKGIPASVPVRVVFTENGEKLDAATYFAEATHVANGLQPQADFTCKKSFAEPRQHLFTRNIHS